MFLSGLIALAFSNEDWSNDFSSGLLSTRTISSFVAFPYSTCFCVVLHENVNADKVETIYAEMRKNCKEKGLSLKRVLILRFF